MDPRCENYRLIGRSTEIPSRFRGLTAQSAGSERRVCKAPMVANCTQTKLPAGFWLSTMHYSTTLGHGLPWASPWQPYDDLLQGYSNHHGSLIRTFLRYGLHVLTQPNPWPRMVEGGQVDTQKAAEGEVGVHLGTMGTSRTRLSGPADCAVRPP